MTRETRTTFEVEEKEEIIVSCDNPSCMYQGPKEEFVTFYTHTTDVESATDIYLTPKGEAIANTSQVKSSLDFCHNCLEEMADEDISPEDSVSFDHNGVMTIERKQPVLYESIPFISPILTGLVTISSIITAYHYFGLIMAIFVGLIVAFTALKVTNFIRNILLLS